ncbi:YdhR family protein [Anaerobacillus alkalidiazotrophicus]
MYFFKTKETAEKYLDMHSKRLASFGIADVNAKVFAINSKLTEITKDLVR